MPDTVKAQKQHHCMNRPIVECAYGVIPVNFSQKEPLFLVLQENHGHWSFPKGRGEDGETPLESALRELQEETGITDLSLFDCPPITVHYRFTRDGVQYQKSLSLWVAEVTDMAVTPQKEEIQHYEWLPYTEATRRISMSASISALETAVKYLRQR